MHHSAHPLSTFASGLRQTVRYFSAEHGASAAGSLHQLVMLHRFTRRKLQRPGTATEDRNTTKGRTGTINPNDRQLAPLKEHTAKFGHESSRRAHTSTATLHARQKHLAPTTQTHGPPGGASCITLHSHPRRVVTVCECRYCVAGLLMTECMRTHPCIHASYVWCLSRCILRFGCV